MFNDPQARSGTIRKIQQPITDKRAPVIDSNNQRAAIFQIGNVDITRQWQALVGGRYSILIIHFAIGSQTAMKAGAIPRGQPFRGVLFDIFPDRVILAINLITIVAFETWRLIDGR
jgi:hypothetical protein